MSETGPIRVFARDGKWLVDYGSYAHGYHPTRAQAVTAATIAAGAEHRELVTERDTADPKSSAEREEIADERDLIATERDSIADERDLVADRRDELADEREDAADKRDEAG